MTNDGAEHHARRKGRYVISQNADKSASSAAGRSIRKQIFLKTEGHIYYDPHGFPNKAVPFWTQLFKALLA